MCFIYDTILFHLFFSRIVPVLIINGWDNLNPVDYIWEDLQDCFPVYSHTGWLRLSNSGVVDWRMVWAWCWRWWWRSIRSSNVLPTITVWWWRRMQCHWPRWWRIRNWPIIAWRWPWWRRSIGSWNFSPIMTVWWWRRMRCHWPRVADLPWPIRRRWS